MIKKCSEYGRRESLKRNLYVIIFTLTIYLSVPFTKSLSNFLISHSLFKLSAYLIISLFVLISIIVIFRHIGFSYAKMVCLLIFFAVYLFIIQKYNVPSKKIHFIVYGVLASLLYYALELKIKNYSIFPLSFLILLFIGLGDEFIQYFTPDRHFSFQDMILNGLSGALIFILIFISEKLRGPVPYNPSEYGNKAYQCDDGKHDSEECNHSDQQCRKRK